MSVQAGLILTGHKPRRQVFLWQGSYHNDHKSWDRYACANRAGPDQTAPERAVQSGSTLFVISSVFWGGFWTKTVQNSADLATRENLGQSTISMLRSFCFCQIWWYHSNEDRKSPALLWVAENFVLQMCCTNFSVCNKSLVINSICPQKKFHQNLKPLKGSRCFFKLLMCQAINLFQTVFPISLLFKVFPSMATCVCQ